MKIHSFSWIIAFPFLLAGGVILYFLFFEDKADWYPYLIPLAVIIAAIYAYHPAIDFWWHKKHPPAIPAKLKKLIYNASDFYQNLDEDARERFLSRLGIFMQHKAFYLMRKEKESMPEDMKALIATCAISLTLMEEDYFFKKYDYFIAYQHPFPSPNKQFLHSVEINNEDGVILLNAEQLFQSMIIRSGAFNVGYYAFAEAYLLSFPLSDLSQSDEPSPGKLPAEGPFSLESIVKQIGYKEILFKAVLMALYFQDPGFLKTQYPEFYQVCTRGLVNPHK